MGLGACALQLPEHGSPVTDPGVPVDVRESIQSHRFNWDLACDERASNQRGAVVNRIDLQRLRAEKLIEQHWKELCDLDHGPWSEQWGAASEISKRYLAYREACFQLRAALQNKRSSSATGSNENA